MEYCAKSKTLIKKIRKVYRMRVEKGSGEKLPTPSKKRNTRPENTKVQVDDFDECVIRNIIHYLYATKKEVPTAAKLLTIITEKINFLWGRKSPNKCSEKHWLHTAEVQFEAAHFDRKTRICFMALQVFGANGKIPRGRERNVYVDESWIDSNISAGKERQNLDSKKLQCQEQTNTSTCRK
jgi:hypothetical protein